MTAAVGHRKPWVKWLLFFALWTLIGLAFAGQLYLSRYKVGDPVTWAFALGRALADWYVFAVLSLPVVWLARRVPLEGANWPRHFVIHLAGSMVFSVLWMTLRALIEQWQSSTSFGVAFTHALMATFFFNLLIYWVIVSVSHTAAYYFKYQERTLRASELEKRLVEAKLESLRMQLNPHFLFNTLHSISALMHRDVDAADRTIVLLSDLLRRALDGTNEHEVPLAQELEMLDCYLEIERTRFGDRLTVEMHVAPETMTAQVPNLILQPLVENAIKHGFERVAGPRKIEVHAHRQEQRLILQVSDNGAGLAPGQTVDEGIGLSNTRARLRELYGDDQQLELIPRPGGGLTVRLELPFCKDHGILIDPDPRLPAGVTPDT